MIPTAARSRYGDVLAAMKAAPKRWLITGVAGFIGSNLLEHLLRGGQRVVGIDNFATGYRRNLDALMATDPSWSERFTFFEGDIRDQALCRAACERVDYVLHQAAIGSVSRSMTDPLSTNAANVDGFLTVLVAARDARVRRFVFAGSSSTYGDDPNLPKTESRVGRPLSPYAVTKLVNELYADVFRRNFGLPVIGLRYFNVFGRRQDPNGTYAAVIPRWISQLMRGERCLIYGDGQTSRDFCYVENVVQANILAASAGPECDGEIFNVACGERTTLNDLHTFLRDALRGIGRLPRDEPPEYRPFRPGDVRHSQADIGKISAMLGYKPQYFVREGLARAIEWYAQSADSATLSPAQ